MRRPWFLVLVLLAGCNPAVVAPKAVVPGFPTTTAPSSTASTTSTKPAQVLSAADLEAAVVDVDGFLRQLETVHPEPFHGISRRSFVAELEGFKAELADFTPEQAMVEFMRLTALLSRQGRDGHQFAVPFADAEGPVLPIRVYEFEDGLVVTDALGAAGSLIGQPLTAIGGSPIEEVLELLEPLVPRDSDATVPGFRPIFLLRVDVLEGLGLVREGPIELSGADAQSVVVEPIPYEDFLAWSGGFTTLPVHDDLRFRDDRPDALWIEFLPEAFALYVRYQQVQAFDTAALDELIDRSNDPEVERVIVDLRHNGGGDNSLYPPLLDVLQSPAVNQPGRLWVLTDRLTFSAASNLATEIEQTTHAIFAGEPMGGGLNFWNDVQFYPLSHLPIPMRAGISTVYWEMTSPDDTRLTIDPDLAVPFLSTDYFEGRDATLEAVLSS